jgi:hypothetical protein
MYDVRWMRYKIDSHWTSPADAWRGICRSVRRGGLSEGPATGSYGVLRAIYSDPRIGLQRPGVYRTAIMAASQRSGGVRALQGSSGLLTSPEPIGDSGWAPDGGILVRKVA